MPNDWKEIAREGDIAVWKPEEGETVEGKLTGITTDVGPNKSTIYEVTEEDGNMVAIWETAVLRSKLEQVEKGDDVKIVYLGKKKSKSTPGSYHDYSVFSRKHTPDEAEEIFDVK